MKKKELEKEVERNRYIADAKIKENARLRLEIDTYKARVDAAMFYLVAIMNKANMQEVQISRAELVGAASSDIEFGQENETYILRVKERGVAHE